MSVTLILIIIIAGISFYAWSAPQIQAKLMMNPYRVSQRNEFHRFITSGFIHSGYIHLFFNLFTLYFFGSQMERIFNFMFGSKGVIYFLILFIVGVIVSDIPTYFKYRHSPGYNSLGASGGVAALVFSFILFNPTEKLYILFIPFGIPGFILGTLFLVYSYYQSKNSGDNINHDAHLYGALFGLVFSTIIQPSILLRFVDALANWRIF